jgi:hypothetical protein
VLTLPFAPVCLTTIQADSQSEQESDHVERELLFAGDTCVRSLLSSLIFDPCVFVCFFSVSTVDYADGTTAAGA